MTSTFTAFHNCVKYHQWVTRVAKTFHRNSYSSNGSSRLNKMAHHLPSCLRMKAKKRKRQVLLMRHNNMHHCHKFCQHWQLLLRQLPKQICLLERYSANKRSQKKFLFSINNVAAQGVSSLQNEILTAKSNVSPTPSTQSLRPIKKMATPPQWSNEATMQKDVTSPKTKASIIRGPNSGV